MPVLSMTGFASAEHHLPGPSEWTASWDVRSVNAKGLDIRLRVPDWVPGLEAAVRKAASARLARGNVALSLRLTRAEAGVGTLNPDALARTLRQLADLNAQAKAHGLTLTAPSSLDLLRDRSLQDSGDLSAPDTSALADALIAQLPGLLDDLVASRQTEGTALHAVLMDQLNQIETAVTAAKAAAKARTEKTKHRLAENVKAIMDSADPDPDRLAQELALLYVKADITEELDRLTAHCATARNLLTGGGAIGRKLDFLCQEFNREANTLCSKSGDADLTAIGLGLKTVIDQMREQVQNVE